METNSKNHDVYQMVTDQIIEKLNQGIVPWQRPWTVAGLPKNLITGKHYRGINILLLNSLGYPTNLFLTFKQVKELGGNIKKGEKAHMVVFWKLLEPKDEEKKNGTEELKVKTFLRYHLVFNVDQCEKIPENKIPQVVNIRQAYPILACEKIVEEMPQCPEIRHNEQLAYYNPIFDFVNMPKKETFVNDESYYSTLFHELVHSTGHESRLKRKELMENGTMKSESYSIEELTAEIGACYLNSYSGISEKQIENNVAYLQAWIGRLKDDKRFIVYSSSRAQQATDFILNQKGEEKAETIPTGNNAKLEKPESHPTFVRH